MRERQSRSEVQIYQRAQAEVKFDIKWGWIVNHFQTEEENKSIEISKTSFSQSLVLQEMNFHTILTSNNLNSVYDESDLSVGGYFTRVGVTILRCWWTHFRVKLWRAAPSLFLQISCNTFSSECSWNSITPPTESVKNTCGQVEQSSWDDETTPLSSTTTLAC